MQVMTQVDEVDFGDGPLNITNLGFIQQSTPSDHIPNQWLLNPSGHSAARKEVASINAIIQEVVTGISANAHIQETTKLQAWVFKVYNTAVGPLDLLC